MKQLILIAIFIQLSIGFLFAHNLPTMEPASNLGPLTFYPDSAKNRLYKMPFDSGLSIRLVRGTFNRPNYTGHKGYEFDFVLPANHPVIASRAGTVTSIGGSIVKIGRADKDVDGKFYVTTDWYIHIRTLALPIKVGDKVKQGQLITYVASGWDHVHLEVQVGGHNGWGYNGVDSTTIESVPIAFVEARDLDGVPVAGKYYLSQNSRYDPADTIATENIKSLSNEPAKLSVLPNPFNPIANINIELGENKSAGQIAIYNISGKQIYTKSFAKTSNVTIPWNASKESAGLYHVRATINGKIYTATAVLIK